MLCIVCAKFQRRRAPVCRLSVSKFCIFSKHFAASRAPYCRCLSETFFAYLDVFSCVDSMCMIRVWKYRVYVCMLKTGIFSEKIDFCTKNRGLGPIFTKSRMRHSECLNSKYKVFMRFPFEISENRICLWCLHHLSAYAFRMSDI